MKAEYTDRNGDEYIFDLPSGSVSILPFDSTAENLSRELAQRVMSQMPPPVLSVEVCFFEGESNFAEVEVSREGKVMQMHEFIKEVDS